MTTVCIIGVYFGTFPQYFDLWIKSAEYNNSIDFILFTDQEYQNSPSNVHFIKMSIEDMRQLAEKKLGFHIELQRPYKCCDLRPAYGFIFEDYISNYDFWGHCDFDLIWGDIRFFLNKYNLDCYDKFLTFGHLSLYKNTFENNARFMLDGSLVGDYKTIFQDEHNYAFDELEGVYQIYKKHSFKMFEERIFADISKIYKRFRLALQDVNHDEQLFYWKDGHVFRAYYSDGTIYNDEFIYIHFKERKEMVVHDLSNDQKEFYITNTGFWKSSGNHITLQDIQRYNGFNGKVYERREHKCYIQKEKIIKYKKRMRTVFHLKESIR